MNAPPNDRGRLEAARARLSAMGPSTRDMTADRMLRRAHLEDRIRELEVLCAAQLALPVDGEEPIDHDAAVPLTLLTADELGVS